MGKVIGIHLKRILVKTLSAIGLGLILIVITAPVHEFGHWMIATIDRAQIHQVVWFPYYNGTHFVNAGITVNEFSFSSIYSLIFFKLAGFLILFLPSVVFLRYFFKKGNAWWHTAYILMMGVIIGADHDFLDIGRTLNSIHLTIGLFIIPYIVVIGICFPWYGLKLYDLIKPLFKKRGSST